MQILTMFDRLLTKLITFLHYVSNGLLCLMMIIITFDVIGRNFLNIPLKGTFEITELGSAIIVFLSLAVTHQHKEHITIGFIVDKLPEKARGVLEGLIEFVIFITLLVMTNQLISNAFRVMDRNTTTSDLSLPIYPFLLLAAFATFIFAMNAFVTGLKVCTGAVVKR